MRIPCFLILAFVTFILISGTVCQKQTIPGHLRECYEDGILLLPMSMGTLIEIIRKIELSPYFLMDMRSFANTLFQRFSRDGIEEERNLILDENVIPYTTTGFQSYKYQLLSYYLVPRFSKQLAEDILTLEERCTLHFMLSSSVSIWERGDENTVCLENFLSQKTSSLSNSRRKSSCPIEKGVVETRGFGTVSPNHIISGIATTLQPMLVYPSQITEENGSPNYSSPTKYIDNRWVSTFSGDLAEVLIIQKPKIKENYFFGPGGRWNDTSLPINHYLKANYEHVEKELWQFTEAEIKGAIDGMWLGEEAKIWSQSNRLMRLSQLLEMYYTDKFTNYLIKLHACKRNLFFNGILKKTDVLIEQVESFSQVLADFEPNYLKNRSIISSESVNLVNQFNDYVSMILRNDERCPQVLHTKMRIKLNIIYDNTWSNYETLTFLMNLAERMDVSYHGSTMTVIAGDLNNIIVENCKSINELYLQWKRYVHDQGIMSLSQNLIKLRKQLTSLNEGDWCSHITIILAMSTSLNNKEISESIALIKSIKQQNPDMNFVYITSTPLAPMYVKLTSVLDAQNDKIITSDTRSHHQILNELDSVDFNPIAIIPFPYMDKTNENKSTEMTKEEFVSPSSVNLYRIHPQYLCKSPTVTVKIKNMNHGNLIACLSRNRLNGNEEECQEMSLNEETFFKINNPCASKTIYGEQQTWNENCKPIYLRISGKKTLSLCIAKECRTPHDIQFHLTIMGINYSSRNKNQCSNSDNLFSSLINLLLFFSLFLHILTYR